MIFMTHENDFYEKLIKNNFSFEAFLKFYDPKKL
jgi:hypothetical protein